MSALQSPKSAENEIRTLIDRLADAAHRKDLDGVKACYTPDVRAFDAVVALQFRGTEAYGQHWQACFDMMPAGEMFMDAHDLELSVSGDLAVAHYLQHCGVKAADGTTQGGWMRATVCCRRTADGWRIAHEHYSSPFDPETMKMIDATP